jgi:hypothetical protein
MPIAVTCPNCLTRFTVNEKFAGKSGPCPKCKGTIKIPAKSEEVVIHAPAEKGPKDVRGKSIFKPIRREEAKIRWPMVATTTAVALLLVVVALALRITQTSPPLGLVALAVPLLAIPIVLGGYWFLRDDELQGYTGQELWIRSGICGLAFSLGWVLYAWIPAYLSDYASVVEMTTLEMLLMIAVMIAIGTIAATLSLELEVLQGLSLYMLYFIVTFSLAWISGTTLSAILPGTAAGGQTSVRQSAEPPKAVPAAEPEAPAPPTQSPPAKDIPQLLQ